MASGQRPDGGAAVPLVTPEGGMWRRARNRRFRTSGDQSESGKLASCHLSDVFAIDLDALVESAHRQLVEHSAQERERRDRLWCVALESPRHERCRLAGWKEVSVVNECHEIVARE